MEQSRAESSRADCPSCRVGISALCADVQMLPLIKMFCLSLITWPPSPCHTLQPLVNDLNVQHFLPVSVPSVFPGVHYRKSCASSGACLIASSGYQQFCTGRLNSVCITCCNTPLCNGPRHKKRPPSSKSAAVATLPLATLPISSLLWSLLW